MKKNELDADVPLLDIVTSRQAALGEKAFSLLNILEVPQLYGPFADQVLFSLSLHLLEGTLNAARRGAVAEMQAYRNDVDELVSRFRVDTPIGERLVLQPKMNASDRYLDVDASQMRHLLDQPPCPILWRETKPASAGQREVLAAAFQLACDAGFGALLGGHAAVICLCPIGAGGQKGLQNWTVTLLPGTVYLTVESNPFFVARELVHEAGHNWLGGAFATMERLPDDNIMFYSPWKGVDRPAPAFLHTCWSFSLTVLYGRRVIDLCDPATRKLFVLYDDVQTRLLRSVKMDFLRVLELVEDEQVVEVIRDVVLAVVDS